MDKLKRGSAKSLKKHNGFAGNEPLVSQPLPKIIEGQLRAFEPYRAEMEYAYSMGGGPKLDLRVSEFMEALGRELASNGHGCPEWSVLQRELKNMGGSLARMISDVGGRHFHKLKDAYRFEVANKQETDASTEELSLGFLPFEEEPEKKPLLETWRDAIVPLISRGKNKELPKKFKELEEEIVSLSYEALKPKDYFDSISSYREVVGTLRVFVNDLPGTLEENPWKKKCFTHIYRLFARLYNMYVRGLSYYISKGKISLDGAELHFRQLTSYWFYLESPIDEISEKGKEYYAKGIDFLLSFFLRRAESEGSLERFLDKSLFLVEGGPLDRFLSLKDRKTSHKHVAKMCRRILGEKIIVSKEAVKKRGKIPYNKEAFKVAFLKFRQYCEENPKAIPYFYEEFSSLLAVVEDSSYVNYTGMRERVINYFKEFLGELDKMKKRA